MISIKNKSFKLVKICNEEIEILDIQIKYNMIYIYTENEIFFSRINKKIRINFKQRMIYFSNIFYDYNDPVYGNSDRIKFILKFYDESFIVVIKNLKKRTFGWVP